MSEFKVKNWEDIEKEWKKVEKVWSELPENIKHLIEIQFKLPKSIVDVIKIQTGGMFLTLDDLHPKLQEAFNKLLEGDVDGYNQTMQEIIKGKGLDIKTKKMIFRQLTQFLLSPNSKLVAEKMIEYAKAGKKVFVPKAFIIHTNEGDFVSIGGLVNIIGELTYSHMQGYSNVDIYKGKIASYLYTNGWLYSEGGNLFLMPSPGGGRIRTSKFEVPEIKVITARRRARARAPKGERLPKDIATIIDVFVKNPPAGEFDEIVEKYIWPAIKAYIDRKRQKKNPPKIATLSDEELKALVKKYIEHRIKE